MHMTGYETISTETWIVHLPNGWRQRPAPVQHSAYFESADRKKSACFTTWCFQDEPLTAQELVESFMRVETNSLRAMKGRTWQILDEWRAPEGQSGLVGADFFDLTARDRAVCCILARLPWVVRAAFHDHDCCDYEASRHFFRPIIESLDIHHEEESCA